jgi:hypothetical protein
MTARALFWAALAAYELAVVVYFTRAARAARSTRSACSLLTVKTSSKRAQNLI